METKAISAKAGDSRILAVSDIHGNLELFRQLLKVCAYQPGKDVLVIAGDFLEKGLDSLGTLRFVMELAEQEGVYVLSGNCDLHMLVTTDEGCFGTLYRWQERDYLWQMAKESGTPLPGEPGETGVFRRKLEERYPREFQFLRSLPHILETERYLFAHAGLQGEDLDHQDWEYVVSVPWFPQGTEHRFSKRLVVGHYPTANFREGVINNAPYFHQAHNVLSMDGGNMVKTLGQLNAVILDPDGERWTWTCAQHGERISAPISQQERPGITVIWPHNQVERVEPRGEFTLCRVVESGVLVEIPEEFLHQSEGKLVTGDVTDRRLAVEKGESVTVLRRYGSGMLISKDTGEMGWLDMGQPDL
ncbi:MAG: metallophosphoesterase [Acutalibacter sp.]|jgi:hypothetical protein